MSEEELGPDRCDVCGAAIPEDQTRIVFDGGFPAIACAGRCVEQLQAEIARRRWN
jgi:predicted nucleic acid-binding Zn ribbon protein